MAENLGEATLRLDADGRRLRSALKSAQAQVRQAGLAMAGLGAAIAAPLGIGVNIFREYEQAMANVRAVSGATEEEFAALDAIAKEMGRTTVFTARESAQALSFMSMAGLEAKESVAALPDVLNLAAAGQLELGTAADIVTNVMAGYGIAADNVTMAVDVLTKGFTSANTNLEQLGQAFTYAGPVANAAGIDFEEAAAALALMGNAGFQGTLAGTSLRGAITRLLKPVGEGEEAIERLGLRVFDADGNMRPLVEIVRDLEASGLTAADAMAIFGQRAGPAMLALLEQGSQALEDMTTEMENAGGTAERIAETQLDTFNGQITLLKSALEGMALAIGQILIPVLRRLSERVTPLVQNIVEWTEAHPELTEKIVLAAGAVGGFLLVLGGLALALTTIGPILGALASGPVLLVIAAIGALVAIGWKYREQLVEFAEVVWPGLVSAWENVLLPTFEAIHEYLTQTLVPFIRDDLIPVFVAIGEEAWKVLSAVWTEILKPTFEGIWSFLSTVLIPFIREEVIPLFLAIGEMAWMTLVTIWNDALKPMLQELKETIDLAVIPAIEYLGERLRVLGEGLMLLWGLFRKAWPAIEEITLIATENMLAGIEAFAETTSLVIQALLNAMQGDWDSAWKNLNDAGNRWREFQLEQQRKFGEAFESGMARVWQLVVSQVRRDINTIIGFFNDLIRAWNRLSFRISGFSIRVPAPTLSNPFNTKTIRWEGFTINTPDLPTIPYLRAAGITPLATGGIVRSPTLAMIGESGPEAVVPLNRAGLGSLEIVFNGPVYNTDDLDDVILNALTEAKRRGVVVT